MHAITAAVITTSILMHTSNDSSLETPPVVVGPVESEDGPPAMASGTGPVDVGERKPAFRFDGMLPTPTRAEIEAASPDVRPVLEAMPGFGSRVTIEQLDKVLPGLTGGMRWVSKGHWRIQRGQHTGFFSENRERTRVYLGASYYPISNAPLATVRQRERNYKKQESVFGCDDLYPIAETYVTGTYNGSAYTLIETYSEDSWGLYSWTLRFQVLERRLNGRLTVDYVEVSGNTYWGAGRDVWLEVWDGDTLVGHACVSQFGMDIRGVPDSTSDITESISTAHRYMQTGK